MRATCHDSGQARLSLGGLRPTISFVPEFQQQTMRIKTNLLAYPITKQHVKITDRTPRAMYGATAPTTLEPPISDLSVSESLTVGLMTFPGERDSRTNSLDSQRSPEYCLLHLKE